MAATPNNADSLTFPMPRGRTQSIASLAHASIAHDLENTVGLNEREGSNAADEAAAALTLHSLAGSYRRPSIALAGKGSMLAPFPDLGRNLSTKERETALQQERSLLRDNDIIPHQHAYPSGSESRRQSIASRPFKMPNFLQSNSSTGVEACDEPPSAPRSDRPDDQNETTPLLLEQPSYADDSGVETINKRWEEAVTAGNIHTSWQREVKVLGGYTAPLMATFLLQYSLTMASIFTVGRIGPVELGAVSLASMSANISGYAIYQGLSVSLDTLCAQAYGSGRKFLVGLQMQRMVFLLWLITIPIGIVWLLSGQILHRLVPEPEVAVLASQYLKVLLLGAPGYACFEAGKRFAQAQGIFTASLYVLCVCAPLNALMNWLFVWQFGWGFIGAPIAVAITDNLLPFGLYIYIRYFTEDGMSCWGGFTFQAFHNWTPMIKLAIPGLTMIEAEILASEILTLMSSYFGVTYLAAQSVLATITALAFQAPFPVSVAASTRIANLVGATLGDAARTATKVAIAGATLVGLVNACLLFGLRWYIPILFTDDPSVTVLVAKVLPVCAAFQLFDALGACTNGVLRGLGRQELGAYTQLFCYYAIGIPFSIASAFGLKWHLYGLWTGNAIALASVTFIEAFLLSRISFERAVEEAKVRNSLD